MWNFSQLLQYESQNRFWNSVISHPFFPSRSLFNKNCWKWLLWFRAQSCALLNNLLTASLTRTGSRDMGMLSVAPWISWWACGLVGCSFVMIRLQNQKSQTLRSSEGREKGPFSKWRPKYEDKVYLKSSWPHILRSARICATWETRTAHRTHNGPVPPADIVRQTLHSF